MDARHWLEQLRAELVRRELPLVYVQRFVDELTDHITDSTEDSMRKDAHESPAACAALGDPTEIAAQAASHYQARTFAGRHPVWSFVVLPIVALPALWVASAAISLLAGESLGYLFASFWPWMKESHPRMIALCVVGWLWVYVAPAMLSAIVFSRLARRAAVNWRWSMAACAGLALVGSLVVVDIIPRQNNVPGTGRFLMDPLYKAPSLTFYQLLQMLAPLAVGTYLSWHWTGRAFVGPFRRERAVA